jgi:hypothetical protein
MIEVLHVYKDVTISYGEKPALLTAADDYQVSSPVGI